MYILRLIIQARLPSLLVLLFSLILMSCGLASIDITTDNRVFYGPKNQYFKDLLNFEQKFTSNDNVIFVVTGNAADTLKLLDAVGWLTEKSGEISHAVRVDSITNYPYPRATVDTFEVLTVAEESCSRRLGCHSGLRSVAEEMNLFNRLISPDLKSAGVIVTLRLERGQPAIIEDLNRQILQLQADFDERFPHMQLTHTGGVPMMAAFASASADDLARLLPITLIVIGFLTVVFLGSARLAAILIFSGVAASAATMGLAGWMGLTINNATSIAPMVILVLVISTSMHTVMRFQKLIQDGTSPQSGTLLAVGQTIRPLSVSVVTSLISLLSLYFIDSPPLQQLGVLSATGLLIGFILTITLTPILLAMGVRPPSRLTYSGPSPSRGLKNILYRFPSIFLCGISFLTLLFLSIGLSRLHIDDNFVKFFDESIPFRMDTELATALLTGPNHIEVVLTSKPEESVFDPEFIRYLESLTSEIRTLDNVRNAAGFSDMILQVARSLDLEQPFSDFSEEEIYQIFLAYELSLKQGQSNTDLISLDHRSARVSILLDETSSRDIQQLERSIVRIHNSRPSGYEINVTGENIPVAHLSEMNINSMINGLFFSALIIGIVTSIVLRSIFAGLIGCFAVAFPLLAGFGAWGWLAGEIGIAATAIIGLTMGVVVDDNAHFLFEVLKRDNSFQADIRGHLEESIITTFPAVTATSAILGAGLAVLSFSHFEVNRTFGVITCVIVVFALATTVFILPYLAQFYLRISGNFAQSISDSSH